MKWFRAIEPDQHRLRRVRTSCRTNAPPIRPRCPGIRGRAARRRRRDRDSCRSGPTCSIRGERGGGLAGTLRPPARFDEPVGGGVRADHRAAEIAHRRRESGKPRVRRFGEDALQGARARNFCGPPLLPGSPASRRDHPISDTCPRGASRPSAIPPPSAAFSPQPSDRLFVGHVDLAVLERRAARSPAR